jgi:hypothetical protein
MVRCIVRPTMTSFCVALLAISAMAQDVDVSMKIVVNNQRQSGGAGQKKSSDASDVVVWLSPLQELPSQLPIRQHAPYRLLQKDKQFSPHLLVVPTGSSVEFPNEDPFFHNVFSLFNGKRFDLGLYESGTTRSVRFDREGVSYIFCNIHPGMGAVVMALSTPFYAISGADGRVDIHGVPPGSYRLEVWSERARPLNQNEFPRVVQIAGETKRLEDIVLTTERSPLNNHKNKFGEDYKPEPVAPY